MAFLQHSDDVIQIHVLLFEQHQKVEQQIGGFAPEQVVVIVFGFDDEFNGFLTHLLCNLVHTFFEQTRRVRHIGRVGFPLVNDGLQVVQELRFAGIYLLKTRIGTGMANRTGGCGLNKQRIAIAVDT